MLDQNTSPAPGGWTQASNSRIASWLVVGALASSLGGGYAYFYGHLNGAQATQTIEASVPSGTKNTVTSSFLNPLPNGMTGMILPTNGNYVFAVENTAPKSRLNICTATSSTTICTGVAGVANVGSGIDLSAGAKRLISLSLSGGLTAMSAHGNTVVTLSPRDSNGKKFLNFTWMYGSGATADGNPAANVHIEIQPCNISGIGC